MPRFDPETIAALAEGRLSPDEAARVEAAIANDPAALAELEMQRAAIEALGSAPELRLTELESRGLHASVADALGLVATAPEAAAAPRRVPWGSLGIAAAALFGLIAVVPVVGLLNTAGDDAGEVALAPTATTTRDLQESDSAAEADDSLGDTAAAVTEDGSFDAGEEAPGEDLLGFGTTTTVAARATTTTAEPADDQATSTTDTTVAAGESTTTTATTESETQSDMDRLLSDLVELRDDPDAIEAVSTEALDEDACWDEDTEYRGGSDPGDRWFFEYTEGEASVVVYFRYDSEGVAGPFAVYEPAECDALAEIPEAE